MSEQKIKQLISSEGKVRTFELDSGEIVERDGGSVSWRNNNPGNLKFEFEGSADKTVHNNRSKEQALARAQKSYDGVVALDQWGNAVFETYEAGRAAKLQLLQRKYAAKDVEGMLQNYSIADYTGGTHHRAQADFIFQEGDCQGLDLRKKTIGEMSNFELAALADGIRGFEGWKVGKTNAVQPQLSKTALDAERRLVTHQQRVPAPQMSVNGRGGEMKHGAKGDGVRPLQDSLQRLGYCGLSGEPLKPDGDFGPNTTHAIKSFQRAHHLHVDGIAGKHTLAALEDAKRWPLLSEATHPRHAMYEQAVQKIHALPHRAHRGEREIDNAAVALTIAAHAGGLLRIDHVVLGTNGVNLFAVQGPLDDPGHRRVQVDFAHAVAHTADHRQDASPVARQVSAMAVQQQTQRGPAMGGP